MDLFSLNYVSDFKIFLTAIFIYVIIYSLLLKMKIFGTDNNVNSLVAIISAVIVSFTGIVTYILSYAITWFIILLLIFLMIFILLAFLGVKLDDIYKFFSSNSKVVLIIFILLFSIIFLKGFFGVNNTFDLNNPQDNSYNVSTDYNTGVDDIVDTQKVEGSFSSFFSSVFQNDMLGTVIFLIILGVFVFIMG